MAGALIAGAAGLAITAVDIGPFFYGLLGSQKVDPQIQTSVTVIIGSVRSSDGSVPDIYVKGPYGYRLAEYSDKNGHLRGDSSRQFILNNLPGIDLKSQTRQPYYVSLVAGSDAICLSAIVASGNAAQYTWTGDMGQYCGADWYNSKFSFGTSSAPVKCVWLDGDHSNNIVASGLSLHMTDFSGGLLQQ